MRWLGMGAAILAAVVAFNVGSPGALVARQGADDDCMENPLGPVPGYSIMTSGDADLMNTEADGRAVFGGNALLGPYGVATKLPVQRDRIDLAVGKSLTVRNSLGVNNGSVTYGVSITPSNYSVPNGTVTKAAPPYNMTALFDGLLIRSVSWNELDVNGTVTQNGDQLTLSGTDAVRNVFRLSAATFNATRLLTVSVPAGSTVLINMPDGAYSEARMQDIIGATPEKTLWNLPNATTFDMTGTARFQGTLLAPRAAVTLGYLHDNGSIVAASVKGTGEIGINPIDPCLPDPTPCPMPTPTPTPTPTATPTPTPTSTPTATPTSTPTATSTPLPTVSPGPTPTIPPIVTPTPTPEPNDPSEPLDPEETPGIVIVEGGSSEVDICKKVMTKKGRALEQIRVHPGDLVKFRIRVTNLGTDVASNARVCDIVPPGLRFVRATVKVTYRNGRPCVTIPVLTGQREGFVWMRVLPNARGKITNVAAVTSRAGGTRTNPASVRVIASRVRGGVTG